MQAKAHDSCNEAWKTNSIATWQRQPSIFNLRCRLTRSLQPTPVGAGSSAFAVHTSRPAWLSSIVRRRRHASSNNQRSDSPQIARQLPCGCRGYGALSAAPVPPQATPWLCDCRHLSHPAGADSPRMASPHLWPLQRKRRPPYRYPLGWACRRDPLGCVCPAPRHGLPAQPFRGPSPAIAGVSMASGFRRTDGGCARSVSSTSNLPSSPTRLRFRLAASTSTTRSSCATSTIGGTERSICLPNERLIGWSRRTGEDPPPFALHDPVVRGLDQRESAPTVPPALPAAGWTNGLRRFDGGGRFGLAWHLLPGVRSWHKRAMAEHHTTGSVNLYKGDGRINILNPTVVQ